MTKIFIHGSGQKADSWKETVSFMTDGNDVLCPELSGLLKGEKATYNNLFAAFDEYCGGMGDTVDLCGLSLGGILALDYTLRRPEKVRSLVCVGTPGKVPKAAFALQNIVFRLLPKSVFKNMAFDKKDTFALGGSMKNIDFTDRARMVECPTLIVCGEKDRANIKSAEFLAKNIKTASLEIIGGAGHAVNQENPEALAKDLGRSYAGMRGVDS